MITLNNMVIINLAPTIAPTIGKNFTFKSSTTSPEFQSVFLKENMMDHSGLLASLQL